MRAPTPRPVWHRLAAFDALIAGAALALVLLLPLLDIGLRPLFGKGIENAPVLVQHLGLVLAMFGALVAERGQHLSSLGAGLAAARAPRLREAARIFAQASAALLCGMLTETSWTFVASEMEAPHAIAFGIKRTAELSKDKIVIVNLSGRGDKDVQQVAAILEAQKK